MLKEFILIKKPTAIQIVLRSSNLIKISQKKQEFMGFCMRTFLDRRSL